MDRILNIETSTGVCSVTISSGRAVLAARESVVERSHAAMLTVFIQEAVSEAGISVGDLSAVAVSRGPGSYTGLRIGVSAAKGICYGAGVPLIAIDTLKLMALKVTGMLNPGPHENDTGNKGADNLPVLMGPCSDNVLLCPMIDARRMEVYTALYDIEGGLVKDVSAEIIDESSFRDIPDEQKILFFGDGSDKCKDVISHPNTHYIPDIYPSAVQMAELSHKAFAEGRFEDTAYFEPFYLKDFIATTPKNKMI